MSRELAIGQPARAVDDGHGLGAPLCRRGREAGRSVHATHRLLLKLSSIRLWSSGVASPMPIVLTQRYVMPCMARQAPSSAAHSAAGTCDSVMRPSIPNCAGSRPASRTNWWSRSTMPCDSGRGRKSGHPAIGQARGALHDHLALTPHPDGDAPPWGSGLIPASGMRCHCPSTVTAPRPERAHRPRSAPRRAAAVTEVLAQRLELDGVPADAHAEPQAPARQHVDGGRLLGDERRCRCGRIRIPVASPSRLVTPARKPNSTNGSWNAWQWVAALPAAGPLGVRSQDVVKDEHVRIAHRLDRLRIVAVPRRIRSDLDPCGNTTPMCTGPSWTGARHFPRGARARRPVVRLQAYRTSERSR